MDKKDYVSLNAAVRTSGVTAYRLMKAIMDGKLPTYPVDLVVQKGAGRPPQTVVRLSEVMRFKRGVSVYVPTVEDTLVEDFSRTFAAYLPAPVGQEAPVAATTELVSEEAPPPSTNMGTKPCAVAAVFRNRMFAHNGTRLGNHCKAVITTGPTGVVKVMAGIAVGGLLLVSVVKMFVMLCHHAACG
jgi:hypothetical protein